MAQRYQNGHLRKAKRKRGPDVREFLWRESGLDGMRRQRTLTVGNVQELRTEREARIVKGENRAWCVLGQPGGSLCPIG